MRQEITVRFVALLMLFISLPLAAKVSRQRPSFLGVRQGCWVFFGVGFN
jgi:hypothetical protein